MVFPITTMLATRQDLQDEQDRICDRYQYASCISCSSCQTFLVGCEVVAGALWWLSFSFAVAATRLEGLISVSVGWHPRLWAVGTSCLGLVAVGMVPMGLCNILQNDWECGFRWSSRFIVLFSYLEHTKVRTPTSPRSGVVLNEFSNWLFLMPFHRGLLMYFVPPSLLSPRKVDQ